MLYRCRSPFEPHLNICCGHFAGLFSVSSSRVRPGFGRRGAPTPPLPACPPAGGAFVFMFHQWTCSTKYLVRTRLNAVRALEGLTQLCLVGCAGCALRLTQYRAFQGDFSDFACLLPRVVAVPRGRCHGRGARHGDPRGACFHARRALELQSDGCTSTTPHSSSHTTTASSALLHEPTFRSGRRGAFAKARLIKDIGNQAVHSNRPIRQYDAPDRRPGAVPCLLLARADVRTRCAAG